MAFRTQKISQMTPKGSDLEATDLIEVSTIESGSYVTRSITGQELIDAIPLPPSGITIGATAITSGTVGRVLFEGTGNVVQESANLFWDNTNGTLEATTTADNLFGLRLKSTTGQLRIKPYLNSTYGVLLESKTANGSANLPLSLSGTRLLLLDGNVLINTTTDAGFKLDVNGTARVQGNTTITSADVANPDVGPPAFNIFNGTFSKFNVVYDAAGCRVNMLGTSTQGLRINTGSSTNFSTIGGGGLTFSCSTNNFQIISASVLFNVAGSEKARFAPSTGNLLINTTTDAGFKLDVNGTARVSGNTTIVGNITQSGANTTNLGYITNATLGVYGNTPAASTIGLLVGCVTNGGHTAIFTKGNNSGSTAIRITDQNVGASINHFLVDFAGASGFGIANGTTVVNASAQVEIQSTTKGFLPPRMTTTQKNAIATPAAGLMVYDTTLNLISYYNGTSWI